MEKPYDLSLECAYIMIVHVRRSSRMFQRKTSSWVWENEPELMKNTDTDRFDYWNDELGILMCEKVREKIIFFFQTIEPNTYTVSSSLLQALYKQ